MNFRHNQNFGFLLFFMALEIPATLAERLASGDEQAFREFYLLASEAVKAYILYRTYSDRDACADIMAEVFLDAYKYRTRLKTNKNTAAWLYTIARHKILDHYRSYRRQQKIVEKKKNFLSLNRTQQEGIYRPDEILFEKHESYGLRAALLKMNEEERAVLVAKYVEEKSVRDIAQSKEKSEKAIESILYRARKNFAQAIQEIGNERTHVYEEANL